MQHYYSIVASVFRCPNVGRRTIIGNPYPFCGWERLQLTVNNLDPLTCGLFTTIFNTGGRASELLELKRENFGLSENPDEDHIMVYGMSVRKHRKKFVRSFPIFKSNPLYQPMVDYVEKIPEGRKLFSFSRYTLWRMISNIERGEDQKVGPWWPHRLRSERANQLVQEMNFNTSELMEFFGWAQPTQASHYITLHAENLIRKMRKGMNR